MDTESEKRLTKLFVGGISRDTTSDSLKGYFEKFGELSDCVVICDSVTKQSRGFGYVTFKDPKSTTDVLNEKTDGPHIIDDKECEVKRAIPKDSSNEFAHQKTNKIFMGGLPEDASEDDVRDVLTEKLGKPPATVTVIMRNDDRKKNKGYCFVDLNCEDDADTLFCMRRIEIQGKEVEIKKADPRGKSGRGGGGGRGGRGGFSSRGGSRYGGQEEHGGRYGGNGSGYGSNYGGYGASAYTGYDYPYGGATSGYYDNSYYGGAGTYGAYGTAAAYGAYDPSYNSLGVYSQAASSYGPAKGSYGVNGSTSHGSGAGYRPY